MRITTNQIIRNLQRQINDRYYDLSRLQEQTSTGKRLLKPSDQPLDVGNALKMRDSLAGLSQFKANMQDGLGFMSSTDTAMTSMNDLLQRMRELAVEGSTDTITSDERVYINSEVQQLSRQLVAFINTQYKGDFIFNGTQTKIPPLELKSSAGNTADDYAKLNMAYFNAAGVPVPATVQLMSGFDNAAITDIIPGSFSLSIAGTAYRENVDYTMDYKNGTITVINPTLAVNVSPGTANYSLGQAAISFDYLAKGKDVYGATVSNHGQIARQIDENVTAPINISADEFMNDPTTGADMIGTIISMGQDLLQNNRDGIANALDRIDTVFNALHSARGKNGARVNRFEATQTRNDGQTTNDTQVQSNLEDAEMAKTITDYMNMQNVYNAALKSAAGVIQQSLVNFL
jgi:flagellar hook-associated protein 3 FlgL